MGRVRSLAVVAVVLGGLWLAAWPASSDIPTADLILHLSFENDGTDNLGNHPAEYVGQDDYIPGPGPCGSALVFQDGFEAYIPDDFDSDFPEIPAAMRPAEFTISFWAQANTPDPNGGTWVSNLVTDETGSGGFEIVRGVDGNDRFAQIAGSGFGATPDATVADPTAWHHIAATWDGVSLTLWIDGVLSASATPTTSLEYPAFAHDLLLGHNDFVASVDGAMDELRFYAQAYGAAEIQALAEECRNDPAPDYTGYGYDCLGGYGYGYSCSPGGGGGSFGPGTQPANPNTPPDSPPDATPDQAPEQQPPADQGPPAPAPVSTPATRTSVYSPHNTVQIKTGAFLSVDGEAVGPVEIQYTGEEDPGSLRFVLWADDGTHIVLATGVSTFSWDSSTVGNGVYTLQVEQRGPDGFRPLQAGGDVLATRAILIRNPVSATADAVAAAAAGTAFAGAAAALASRIGVVAELVKEGSVAYGEDRLKESTDKRGGKVRGLARVTTAIGAVLAKVRDFWAVAATVALLTVFFSIEGMEQDTLRGFLDALPVVGLAAVVFGLGALGLESVLAHASKARASVRMYGPGILSLIVSSVVFRSAFGYPSYVDEVDESGRSDELPDHIEGLRALFLILSILIAFPLFALGGLWNFDLMEEGFVVTVAGLAGAAMPIKPLPGYDLWKWNKAVAMTVFAAGIGIFVGVHTAFIPVLWLFGIGLAATAAYLGGLVWLKAQFGKGETSLP